MSSPSQHLPSPPQQKLYQQPQQETPPQQAAALPVWKGAEMKLFPTLDKMAISHVKGKGQDSLNGCRLHISRLRKYFIAATREKTLSEGKDFYEKLVDELTPLDFDQDAAYNFKEYMIEDMELSNASVNTTMDSIKGHMKICLQKKEIPENPLEYVKRLPKTRGTSFIPFTAEELKKVSDHLRIVNPQLHLFSNFIYTAYIRPKELCGLTVADLDMKKGLVLVRAGIAKGRHTSFRQILPSTRQLIEEMKIMDQPLDEPIFISICGKDKSLRSRRRKVTELWNKIVIDFPRSL